jgi:hypothetical protein
MHGLTVVPAPTPAVSASPAAADTALHRATTGRRPVGAHLAGPEGHLAPRPLGAIGEPPGADRLPRLPSDLGQRAEEAVHDTDLQQRRLADPRRPAHLRRWRAWRDRTRRRDTLVSTSKATAGSWSSDPSRGACCARSRLAALCQARGLGCRRLEAVGYFLRPLRRLSRSTTVLPGRRFSVPFLRKRPVIASRTRLPLPAPRCLAMG